MSIVIHERRNYLTDGACRGNPGPGGWGALIKFEMLRRRFLADKIILQIIKWNFLLPLRTLNLKEPCNVELFTDSKYVMDGITQWIENWKKIIGKLLLKKRLKIKNYGNN